MSSMSLLSRVRPKVVHAFVRLSVDEKEEVKLVQLDVMEPNIDVGPPQGGLARDRQYSCVASNRRLLDP